MPVVPEVYILDGGLGTTLVDQFGFEFDDSNSLWSSQLLLSESGKEMLMECHSAFVDAGAYLITTATYQVSIRELIRSLARIKNIDDKKDEKDIKTKELETRFAQSRIVSTSQQDRQINCERLMAKRCMRDAVNLVRTSLGKRKGMVVLSLGAAGACLKPSQEYTGNYSGSEVGSSVLSIRNWHLERIFSFTDYGEDMEDKLDQYTGSCWNEVDLVAFETLPLLQEIIAVREAMSLANDKLQKTDKSLSPKDFWISCVFPGDGACLPDGSSVIQVVRAMLGKRENSQTPIAIGINCIRIQKLELLIEKYEAAIKDMILNREIQEWPGLVIYPDGTNGEVYNTQTRQWEIKEDNLINSYSWDEIMYNIINNARNRGHWKLIYAGGCCKTYPEHIKRLSAKLKLI